MAARDELVAAIAERARKSAICTRPGRHCRYCRAALAQRRMIPEYFWRAVGSGHVEFILGRRKLIYGSLAFAGTAGLLGTKESAGNTLPPTPAQTPGPFYPVSLPQDSDNDLVHVSGHSGAADRRASSSPRCRSSSIGWRIQHRTRITRFRPSA